MDYKLFKHNMKVIYCESKTDHYKGKICLEKTMINNICTTNIFICTDCPNLNGFICKDKNNFIYSYLLGSMEKGCAMYENHLARIILDSSEINWETKENFNYIQ